jgi:hypothetical protein
VRELDKVERSLDDVGDAGKRSGRDLGRASDGFDKTDTAAMGFRDTMTGTEDTMKGVADIARGDLFTGFLTLGMGIGDLASGMVNAVIPALGAMKAGMLTTAKTAVTTAATHVASVAKQVAAWVVLGAQATLHAIKVAAAWVISMGPIVLVGAAIIGLTILVVKNFDKIKAAIMTAFNWVRDNWPLILAILTGPIGLAVLAIVKNWDEIKAGFVAVKDAIAGAVGEIVGFVTGIPGRIGAAAASMFNPIKSGFTSAKEWVRTGIDSIVGFVAGIPGRVASVASGAFNGVKDAFRSAINWVIDGWNGLSFTLPKFGGQKIMGKTVIPAFGGQTIGTPNLQRLHSGGTFRSAMPGGEGLALLSDRERVLRPGEPMPGSMAMAGGGTIIQLVLDRKVISEIVRDDLVQIAKRNGTSGVT